MLLPVQTSGNVAQFTFNATFIETVEELEMPIETGEPYLLFFKLIQSVKEALNHDPALDVMHLVCDVRNTARDKHSQKRIYFNKEILPMGQIACTLNDTIRLTFCTKHDDDIAPFASFDFRVLADGLEQISKDQLSAPIRVPLKTWTAKTAELPVNLSKTNTYTRRH